jgi:hypothetical protein
MTLFLPLCKCNLIGRYAPFYAIVTHAHRNDTFYRFGKVLERLAEGIASGRIPVPK